MYSYIAIKSNTPDTQTGNSHTFNIMPSLRDIEEKMEKTHNLDQQQKTELRFLKSHSIKLEYRDKMRKITNKIKFTGFPIDKAKKR